MPRGSTWKIAIYGAEHGIPHFHVETRRSRCTVSIEPFGVVTGNIAAKDLHAALAWARANQARLRAQWNALNR